MRHKTILVIVATIIVAFTVTIVGLFVTREKPENNPVTPKASVSAEATPTVTDTSDAGQEVEYEKVCAGGGDGSHGEPCEWIIKRDKKRDYYAVSPTDNSTPHYGSPDKEIQRESRKAFSVAKRAFRCLNQYKQANRDDMVACAQKIDAGGFTEWTRNFWTDKDIAQAIRRGEKVDIEYEEDWEIDITRPYTRDDMWILLHAQLRYETKYMSKEEKDELRIARNSDPYLDGTWVSVHVKKKPDGTWGAVEFDDCLVDVEEINDWPNRYVKY